MTGASSAAALLAAACEQVLQQHVPEAETVCVALSGGMDSRALLDIACAQRQRWQVRACHVNHGISRYADSWEQFCRRVCADADVPLTVVKLPPLPQGGEYNEYSEQQARQARLDAFARVPAAAMLLAHHADDQIETLLFRLLRGSGVRGLGAMQPAVALPSLPLLLLRPWLAVSRRVIADYAREKRLRWIEDDDNPNVLRRRNYLRRHVVPLLAPTFADPREKLSAAAERLREGADLLQQLAQLDEDTARQLDGGLQTAYFRCVGAARTRNWLYYALRAAGREQRASFSEQHIYEAARQILHCRRGFQLRFAEWTLHGWREAMYWDKPLPLSPPTAANFSYSLSLCAGDTALPQLGGRLLLEPAQELGQGLSPAKTGAEITLRLRGGGERLKPRGRRTLKLTALLQAAGVFPWRRQRLPLIFAGGELAAIANVAVAEKYAAAADEKGICARFVWDEQKDTR